jgi:pimeloyl-ACP methyl ester carboxylesterase
LVIVPGWLSQIDMLWGDRGSATFVGELASFARVVLYDKRGAGLSDPVNGVPTLESRVDDLRAVLDAAGSEWAALFGIFDGGPTSMRFAATYPERVRAMVLYGTFASGLPHDDGSPGRANWSELITRIRATIDHWGMGHTLDWAAPSLSHDPRSRSAVGALERAGMKPRMAELTLQAITQVDVRNIVDSVHVPTLVLHRNNEAIPIEFARELAAIIPSARLVELDGIDHWPTVGDMKLITGEIEKCLTRSNL